MGAQLALLFTTLATMGAKYKGAWNARAARGSLLPEVHTLYRESRYAQSRSLRESRPSFVLQVLSTRHRQHKTQIAQDTGSNSLTKVVTRMLNTVPWGTDTRLGVPLLSTDATISNLT